jgi:hypothetical protein
VHYTKFFKHGFHYKADAPFGVRFRSSSVCANAILVPLFPSLTVINTITFILFEHVPKMIIPLKIT